MDTAGTLRGVAVTPRQEAGGAEVSVDFRGSGLGTLCWVLERPQA